MLTEEFVAVTVVSPDGQAKVVPAPVDPRCVRASRHGCLFVGGPCHPSRIVAWGLFVLHQTLPPPHPPANRPRTGSPGGRSSSSWWNKLRRRATRRGSVRRSVSSSMLSLFG